jgi:hypothetical protein
LRAAKVFSSLPVLSSSSRCYHRAFSIHQLLLSNHLTGSWTTTLVTITHQSHQTTP